MIVDEEREANNLIVKYNLLVREAAINRFKVVTVVDIRILK